MISVDSLSSEILYCSIKEEIPYQLLNIALRSRRMQSSMKSVPRTLSGGGLDSVVSSLFSTHSTSSGIETVQRSRGDVFSPIGSSLSIRSGFVDNEFSSPFEQSTD